MHQVVVWTTVKGLAPEVVVKHVGICVAILAVVVVLSHVNFQANRKYE